MFVDRWSFFRKTKKLHISGKKIYQNDLDDIGSLSYLSLVSIGVYKKHTLEISFSFYIPFQFPISVLSSRFDLHTFQYRFATKWEIFVIFIGIIFTCLKSFAMPILIVIYGEFTTLLVERTLGIGTSSKTYFLPLFGGGNILYV